jgi:hypothetical protein
MTIVTTAHMNSIDPSVTRRQKVEQRIASALVSSLLGRGYSLAVAQGGEDEGLATTSKRRILALLGECDKDYLFVYAPAPSHIRTGWVHLVYGNDGNDVIADYTCNLEPDIAPVSAFAETL